MKLFLFVHGHHAVQEIFEQPIDFAHEKDKTNCINVNSPIMIKDKTNFININLPIMIMVTGKAKSNPRKMVAGTIIDK